MQQAKTTQRRMCAVLLCLLALMLGISVCAHQFTNRARSATDAVFSAASGGELFVPQSTYVQGETLTVPAVKCTAGGTTVDATVSLRTPDGRSQTVNELTLTQTGDYVLTYAGVVGGDVYTKDSKFSVVGAVATAGAKSSISYGKNTYLPDDMQGLNVRLAEGETLDFTEIIDLNDWNKDLPLVELLVTPNQIGTADFSEMVLTFTDVEDASRTMRIRLRQSGRLTCYHAAGGDQLYTSWEYWSNKVYVQMNWGSSSWHSFTGEYEDPYRKTGNNYNNLAPTKIEKQFVSIKFDPLKKQLFCDAADTCTQNGQYTRHDILFIDLDETKWFNELWLGFASQKVRLSVTAGMYAAPTANFFVKTVAGKGFTSLALPESAPTLNVDVAENNVPQAQTRNAYLLPAATAFDKYGDVPVSVEVYRQTGIHQEYAVENGAFTPDVAGDYTVKYTALSRTGKKAEKTITVTAGNLQPLSVTVTGATLTATAGEVYTINSAWWSVTGGNGETASATVQAVRGGETIAIDVEELTFTPAHTGTYKIVYTLTDTAGFTATADYDITVSAPDGLRYVNPPVLPKTLISGGRYMVPAVYAYDYATETETLAVAEITDDKGTYTVTAGNVFVPVVYENGNVTVSFKAGDATLPYSIPCILGYTTDNDGRRLRAAEYLVGEGVEKTPGSLSTTVTATAQNGSWTFANKLLVDGIYAQFGFMPQSSQFDALTVTLTDSENPALSVSASIVPERSSGALETVFRSGNGDFVIDNLFTGEGVNELSVYYDNGVWTNGNWRITALDAQGKPFAGFKSDFVYLTVAFTGADTSGKAAYVVNKISDQQISTVTRDRGEPRIVIKGDVGGYKDFESEVTLSAAIAADVLDPYTSFSVTVYDPEDGIVESTDGVLLQCADPTREYTVKLTKYGVYRVSYVAMDSFGNTRRFNYMLPVADRTAPVIEFKHAPALSIAANGTIVIPDYTVRDNLSVAEKITVNKYIISPSGKTHILNGESNALIPKQSGAYQVFVMAFDEAGNAAVESWTVQVG